MSVYHTAESYGSVKHCACAIAFSSTPLSSGSRCASACATLRYAGARHTSAAASRAPRRRSSSVLEARAVELQRFGPGELATLGIAPAAVLELARLQPALGDDQAVRDPE